jgi:methyl-accepting chemotaxis protein
MLLAIVLAEKNLVLAETPQQVETGSQELQQQRDAFNALADKLNSIASVEGRKRLDVLRAGFQRYSTAQDRVREMMRQGQVNDARALSAGDLRQLVHTTEGQLVDLVQLNQQFVTDAETAATRQYENARLTPAPAPGSRSASAGVCGRRWYLPIRWRKVTSASRSQSAAMTRCAIWSRR